MTRDQMLIDAERAFKAAFPERADEMMEWLDLLPHVQEVKDLHGLGERRIITTEIPAVGNSNTGGRRRYHSETLVQLRSAGLYKIIIDMSANELRIEEIERVDAHLVSIVKDIQRWIKDYFDNVPLRTPEEFRPIEGEFDLLLRIRDLVTSHG